LRAGLLSDREVIDQLSRRFVSTAAIIDDVEKRAQGGDPLAQQLAAHWEYPLELMFLTPTGTVVSKLNSFKDFPGIHPDVAAPPKGGHGRMAHDRAHIDVFLKHVADHFTKE
jgi:hypothetical protein